jgi:hypothetical protein
MTAFRCLVAALSVLALTVPALADPPAKGEGDILDEAKRREQVAVQKVEADFRAAVAEVHRLSGGNPARAAERLKKMLSVLDEDTVLPEARRLSWQRMLKERIRVLEAEAAGAAKDAAEDAERKVRVEERQAQEDKQAREEQKIRDGLNTVRRLQNEGRSDEADRVAADLARRYPDNVAAGAARRITGANEMLRQVEELKAERARRTELALLDVQRSAMPPVGDIEFPSPERWREITKMRTKSKMTEKERALMQALDSPISVNFKGSTFGAAIDYLETLTGLAIIVDKATLDAAGVGYDAPVNTSVKNVALRTALRKLLGEVGLTYIIKDEVIRVVTPQEARDTMTVRTYYLGDLAAATEIRLGPVFSQLQMANTVSNLIQMIVGSVEPDSWAINNAGGKGTIFFDPRTLTLIVKQSAEVHYMLGGYR